MVRTHRGRLATVLLAALFLLSVLPGGASAAEPPRWRVTGAPRLQTGRAARDLAIALYAYRDGRTCCLLRYTDRGQKLHFAADRVESLIVADGVATIVATGRVNRQPGYRVRIVAPGRDAPTTSVLSVDLSGPDLSPYHAEKRAARGAVRTVEFGANGRPVATATAPAREPAVQTADPTATRRPATQNPAAPTATPTRTPTTSAPTYTATRSPTSSPTKSPTRTPTATRTSSPTQTSTVTRTSSPTESPTSTPTITPTRTPSPTSATTPPSTPSSAPTNPINSPTPAAEAWTRAEVGASATLASRDGRVRVDVPASAVTQGMDITYDPEPSPPRGRGFTPVRTFHLDARSAIGDVHQFPASLTIRVQYTDAELAAAGGDPHRLALRYWDEGAARWIYVPSEVDPATRTVTATVDHFTLFGLGFASVFDDFNGRSTLAASGLDWQVRPRDPTGWAICADAACATTATGDGAYAALDTQVGGDHAATVTLRQSASASGASGLVLRARPDWDRFLLAEVTSAGQVILWRYDGAWTAIGWGQVSLSAGSLHSLSAGASGAVVAVGWDGAPLFQATDVDDSTAGSAGIYVGVQGAHPTLDDFTIEPSDTAAVLNAPIPTPVAAGPSATPVAVGANDSFNRAESEGTLGQADSGQSWRQAIDSAWTSCGGGLACALAPTAGEAYVVLEGGAVDQRVTAVIAARPAGAQGSAAVVARVTSDWTTSLLWVGLDPAGRLEVWSESNGAWTQLAGPIATGKAATTAHTLQVSVAGTTLQARVDGITYADATVPAASATATLAGLYASTGDPTVANWPRYDDFSVVPGP